MITVIITPLTDKYNDSIVSLLVKLGYTVKQHPSIKLGLIVLHIIPPFNLLANEDYLKVDNDLRRICLKLKAIYHSIVWFDGNKDREIIWNAITRNYLLEGEKEEPQQQTKANLTLIQGGKE